MNPFGNNTTNNPGGKGKAPEDLPAGTTIEWSGYYLVGDKRYGEGTQQLTILNETDCRSSWSIDWGTYTYQNRRQYSQTQLLDRTKRCRECEKFPIYDDSHFFQKQ